jgi:hypothetical protein
MSKFDDLFREKLDEEGKFPNANKNWKAMTTRLDAFQFGASAWQQTAVWWKAAAISTALISAALGWKMHDILKENAALEAQIAQMSQILVPSSLDKKGLKSTTPTTPGTISDTASGLQKQEDATAQYPKIQTIVAPSFARPEVTHKVAPAAPQHKTQKTESVKEYPQAILTRTQTDALLAYQSLVDSLQQNITILTAALAEKSAPESAPIAGTSTPVAQLEPDAAIKAQIDRFLQEANIAQTEAVTPAIGSPTPVTEPFKPKKERLLVGAYANKIQFSPAQKNILEGKTYGLNADYHIWNNIWLCTHLEHSLVNINSGNVPSGFQLPDLPKPIQNPGPGPKPNHKLINVASNLDFTQFGLGIRYRLPLPLPVRPVFSIAHQWVRSSENLVSFEFDDPGPKHEEEFFIDRTEKITQRNNWRYGLTLEYPIKSVTIRASADYQQNNKNKALMPNAWNIGAGVAIRLF